MKATFNGNAEQHHVHAVFQQLWEKQRKGVRDDEYFPRDFVHGSFQMKTSVKWDVLYDIAVKPTILETSWRSLDNISPKKFVILATATFLTMPLLLLFTYKWSVFKMTYGGAFDGVMGAVVLVAVVGLAAMVMGAPLYLLYYKIPVLSESSNGRRFAFNTINWAAVLISLGLLICSDLSLDNYKTIEIDGIKRAVLTDELEKVKGTNVSLLRVLKDSLARGSFKPEEAEYYNAVAIELEKKKRFYEAEVAYTMAAKSDPFASVKSYQKNRIAAPKKKAKVSENFCYLPEVDRYVVKRYCNLFASRDRLIHLLDSATNVRVWTKESKPEYMNALAVAYEYVGEKDTAGLIYQASLNTSNEDPLLMLNARKYIEQNLVSAICPDSTKIRIERNYNIIQTGAPQ